VCDGCAENIQGGEHQEEAAEGVGEEYGRRRRRRGREGNGELALREGDGV
jgi:hypothetical protein